MCTGNDSEMIIMDFSLPEVSVLVSGFLGYFREILYSRLCRRGRRGGLIMSNVSRRFSSAAARSCSVRRPAVSISGRSSGVIAHDEDAVFGNPSHRASAEAAADRAQASAVSARALNALIVNANTPTALHAVLREQGGVVFPINLVAALKGLTTMLMKESRSGAGSRAGRTSPRNAVSGFEAGPPDSKGTVVGPVLQLLFCRLDELLGRASPASDLFDARGWSTLFGCLAHLRDEISGKFGPDLLPRLAASASTHLVANLDDYSGRQAVELIWGAATLRLWGFFHGFPGGKINVAVGSAAADSAGSAGASGAVGTRLSGKLSHPMDFANLVWALARADSDCSVETVRRRFLPDALVVAALGQAGDRGDFEPKVVSKLVWGWSVAVLHTTVRDRPEAGPPRRCSSSSDALVKAFADFAVRKLLSADGLARYKMPDLTALLGAVGAVTRAAGTDHAADGPG